MRCEFSESNPDFLLPTRMKRCLLLSAGQMLSWTLAQQDTGIDGQKHREEV